MALDERDIEQFGEAFIKTFRELSGASEASKDVAASLNIEEAIRRKNNKQLTEQQKAELKRDKEKAAAWNHLKHAGTGLVSGIVDNTAAIYSSEKAFSAVTPVLDTMANATKDVVLAIGSFGAGLPVIGGLFKGISQGVSAGISLWQNVTKQQIEYAQKMVDNYIQLANTGVTFGGSLDAMQIAAMNNGMSVETMTKFVTKNAEALNSFNGSVTSGALTISNLTKNIRRENPELLAMYGSVANLNGAMADYAQLQTSMGISGERLYKDMEKGARGYLLQQKELADLTGTSAEALKKQQQELAKDAAFQAAYGKMSRDEQENTRTALAQIQAKYGDEAFKYAKEYISTGGKVMSQTGLMFEGLARPVASSVQQIVGDLRGTGDEYKLRVGELITANSGAVKQFRDSNEMMYKLNQSGVQNDAVKMLSSVGTALYKSTAAQEGAHAATVDVIKTREEADQQAIKTYAGAIEKMEEFKIKMDSLVRLNFDKIGGLVESLYSVGLQMQQILQYSQPVFDQFTKAMKFIIDEVGGKANKAAGWALPGWGEKSPATAMGGPGVQRANQYTGGVPDLVEIKSKSGKSAWVKRELAPRFQAFIDHLDRAGYDIKDLGGYNPRNIAGTNTPSTHSRGTSIDINPMQNPMGKNLITDMPADISKIAAKYGLGWGGDWKNKKDPMHFSAEASEGGRDVQVPSSAAATDRSDDPKALVTYLGQKFEELLSVNKDIRDSNEMLLNAMS